MVQAHRHTDHVDVGCRLQPFDVAIDRTRRNCVSCGRSRRARRASAVSIAVNAALTLPASCNCWLAISSDLLDFRQDPLVAAARTSPCTATRAPGAGSGFRSCALRAGPSRATTSRTIVARLPRQRARFAALRHRLRQGAWPYPAGVRRTAARVVPLPCGAAQSRPTPAAVPARQPAIAAGRLWRRRCSGNGLLIGRWIGHISQNDGQVTRMTWRSLANQVSSPDAERLVTGAGDEKGVDTAWKRRGGDARMGHEHWSLAQASAGRLLRPCRRDCSRSPSWWRSSARWLPCCQRGNSARCRRRSHAPVDTPRTRPAHHAGAATRRAIRARPGREISPIRFPATCSAAMDASSASLSKSVSGPVIIARGPSFFNPNFSSSAAVAGPIAATRRSAGSPPAAGSAPSQCVRRSGS